MLLSVCYYNIKNMSKMKDLAIDVLNSQDEPIKVTNPSSVDLFDGDMSQTALGQRKRSETYVIQKEINGTIIRIVSKNLKQTKNSYEIVMLWQGFELTAEYIETFENTKIDYQLNILTTETALTQKDEDDILEFLKTE